MRILLRAVLLPILSCAFFASSSLEAATVTLDFEGTGLAEGDSVGTIDGVAFSNALFVVQGTPTFAFASPHGGDTGESGSFAQTGNGFIVAGPVDDHNQVLTMDFSSYGSVGQVSFDLVDIDTQDIFTATAFDGVGTQLEAITLNANTPDPGTGDGVVTTISFSVGGIATVQTLNSRAQDAGHGIDNLTFNTSAVVPEPSSMALFGVTCCGLVGINRRRKRMIESRPSSGVAAGQ